MLAAAVVMRCISIRSSCDAMYQHPQQQRSSHRSAEILHDDGGAMRGTTKKSEEERGACGLAVLESQMQCDVLALRVMRVMWYSMVCCVLYVM